MEPEDAIDKRCSHSLVMEDVKELSIHDLTIKWNEEDTEDKWGSALVLRNISDFEIRSFRGRQGIKGKEAPAILLECISDGLIADSVADQGCEIFIEVSRTDSRKIILRNNNTTKSASAVSLVGAEEASESK